ncbi:MAG: glycosyltransferase family 4 protein [Candidatus Hodarchaeota archaeon]
MRICIFTRITTVHNLGGMEQHASIISEIWTRLGHEVTIITGVHPKGIRKDTINGVEFHFLKGIETIRYTQNWWKRSMEKFIELHERHKFDLICSESIAGSSFVKYRLKKKYKIPFVCFVHGTSWGDIKSLLKQSFSLRVVKNILYHLYYYFSQFMAFTYSDLLIAISRGLKKSLEKEFPLIEKKRIIFLPNGVDGQVFHPKLDLRDKQKKTVLMVGRVTEQKGFQYLLSILPDILQQFHELRLIVIGTGAYLPRLKEQAVKLGITNNVEFLGSVPNAELVNYYNQANLFIVPSTGFEGLPYVILEAMACGSTIIASDVGGITTAIEHKSNGILVPQKNPVVLKRWVIELLSNDEESNRLGERARDDYLKYFDLDKINESLLNKFQKLRSKFA